MSYGYAADKCSTRCAENELIVDHLKEEVAEHIMDNSRDCEEIIEVLADCDSKIDRLRNNLDKLSVAKIE